MVRKGIRAGRTLEEIQKAGLPEEWEPFSHGYLSTERWLGLVHRGLRR